MNEGERKLNFKLSKRMKLTDEEDLQNYSKEELFTKIRQLEAHVFQLKNIIAKQNDGKAKKKIFINKKEKRNFDFSKCKKRHILLKFLYLGWDYLGFAEQENSNETIEHHVFEALKTCCLIESRQTCNYHRCGRTDKGVSSFSQVISLTIRSEKAEDGDESTELPYCKMLNRLLPDNIRFISWCPVPENFSARFDCNSRTYKYWFPRGNLDIEKMQEAANLLTGCHDFRNFCKMDVSNAVVEFVRAINSMKISICKKDTQFQNEDYDICEIEIKAKAFLWHQIRCIMGILFLVGEGKENPEVVTQLLDVKTQPRSSMIGEMIKECLSLKTEGESVRSQSCWLIEGKPPKQYTPLLSRPTCASLENRIEHFVKKRRIVAEEQTTSNHSEILEEAQISEITSFES
ncbi:tRNA pseudouridine(38/39) synthase isoform X2 [Bemisia tabaci]|uniref:tRNA pseudouridine(38/39) synthase isoform X2 n=1 Tax=Bemisia tabaci TaxID=7038 RepID=UPI003B283224